jgi:DNA modification methylase
VLHRLHTTDGLRDYGVDGQIGLEETPDAYVEKLVAVFREVRRVLKDDGVLWLNIGDSYAREGGKHSNQPRHWDGRESDPGAMHHTRHVDNLGGAFKAKDLIGIPWRVAFALQADGWYLRQDIIWAKPNPMPESVTDRCTKSHEYIFLLTKSARYYYDNEAVKERQAESSAERALYGWNGRNDDGSNGARTGAGIRKMKESGMSMGEAGLIPLDGMRNKRSVWSITTKPYKEAHFATFPEEIPRTCILAGSKKGDTILDPFSGAGTTGVVAEKLNRKYIGIELNPQYTKMSEDRIYNVQPLFAGLEL